MLRKLHLAIGTLGLVVFALQGQYMDQVHAHLVGMADGPRMIYRSGHIYFLFGSLLNLTLGAYLPERPERVPRLLQLAVSLVVLLAPALILAGFFLEPSLDGLVRPYTRPALYALFGTGVVLALAGFVGTGRGGRSTGGGAGVR